MMSRDFNEDPDLTMLAGLPDYEPSPELSERIRSRCHAALLARQKKLAPLPLPVRPRSSRFALEFSAAALICAGYLVGVIQRAMAVYGF
jgi:hypothetical protein